jgi:hypothetical protein
MKTAKFIEKEQLYQEETTRYWFDIDGEHYAIIESGNDCGERSDVVDFQGYPVDQRIEKEVKAVAHVTDEMRQDF